MKKILPILFLMFFFSGCYSISSSGMTGGTSVSSINGNTVVEKTGIRVEITDDNKVFVNGERMK